MLGGVHCWLPLLHLLLFCQSIGMLPNPLSITVLMMWASTATQLSMPCALLLGSKAKQRRRSCSSFTITALLCFCCCAENVAENLSLMVLSNDRKQEKAFYCFHSKKSHIQNYKKKFRRERNTPKPSCWHSGWKKKYHFTTFARETELWRNVLQFSRQKSTIESAIFAIFERENSNIWYDKSWLGYQYETVLAIFNHCDFMYCCFGWRERASLRITKFLKL